MSSNNSNICNSTLTNEPSSFLDLNQNVDGDLTVNSFDTSDDSYDQNEFNNLNCSSLNDVQLHSNYDSHNYLKYWALKHNITHTALSDLLSWLITGPELSKIPKDTRTLLKTPRELKLNSMGLGQYYYFGLNLRFIYQKHAEDRIDTYSLDFNIDGLPIRKSTQESFWHILCNVSNSSNESPFPVAIFCGPKKPALKDFLRDFVTELKLYLTDGVTFRQTKINIICRSFCCDTPPRAFVKGTKIIIVILVVINVP